MLAQIVGGQAEHGAQPAGQHVQVAALVGVLVAFEGVEHPVAQQQRAVEQGAWAAVPLGELADLIVELLDGHRADVRCLRPGAELGGLVGRCHGDLLLAAHRWIAGEQRVPAAAPAGELIVLTGVRPGGRLAARYRQ
jgi:hypothetical protein